MRRLPILLSLLLALALPAAADPEPPEFEGLVAGHNQLRAQVGTPPLAWSETNASSAQRWAEQLAREDCGLRYSTDMARRETTGENLYQAWGSSPYEGWKRSPAELVARWSAEGLYYDHASQRCNAPQGRQCGQYLQMIWETTTAVGCGRARCPSREVWVCHYTPRGNQEGLKPYGNPPPEPVAPPEVLGCFVEEATPAASPVLSSPHLIPVQ